MSRQIVVGNFAPLDFSPYGSDAVPCRLSESTSVSGWPGRPVSSNKPRLPRGLRLLILLPMWWEVLPALHSHVPCGICGRGGPYGPSTRLGYHGLGVNCQGSAASSKRPASARQVSQSPFFVVGRQLSLVDLSHSKGPSRRSLDHCFPLLSSTAGPLMTLT